MNLLATASQTVGPFFHIGLEKLSVNDLAKTSPGGEMVSVRGRVLDGEGKPVNDALIEIWQANSQGKYLHPGDLQDKLHNAGFRGFGRFATGENGEFHFSTIKPGRVPGPGGTPQAPHLVVTVFMRGLLKQLVTRIYFAHDHANAEDPVLKLVLVERRHTLMARERAGSKGALEWNIILQGQDETVFFDC